MTPAAGHAAAAPATMTGPAPLPPRTPAAPAPGPPAAGPQPGDRYARADLTPNPAAAARARRLVRDTRTQWDMNALADDAEAIAAELAANAIAAAIAPHGTRPAIIVAIHDRPGQLRITVWDNGPGHPRPADPANDAENGRGLAIVDTLTSRHWGWWPTPESGGKVVWASLDPAAPPGPRQHQDAP
jgi:anti-sigma regulatory factor (Ser/Thr protein kinase)